MVKICSVCKEVKDYSEFNKSKSSKTGLTSPCTICCKAAYHKNKDLYKENRKKYYLDNKEKIQNKNKLNRKHLNKLNSLWRKRNREKSNEIRKKSQLKNKSYYEEYVLINKKEISEYGKNYRKQYPHIRAASSAKRKANKIMQTPNWLTKEQLREITKLYCECAEKTKKEGVEYHVDHIIPLQGKDVRGLHVPWNLQILEKVVNIKKGNKVDI